MESIKPKSAKVWWTFAAIFIGLGAIFGAALYGLTREVPRSKCVANGGSWDEANQLCTQISPPAE